MKKTLYSTTNGMDEVPAAAIFPGCRFHGDRADTHHGRQSDEPIDGCGSALLRHQPEQTVWSPATQVFLHLSGSTPISKPLQRFQTSSARWRHGQIHHVARKQLQKRRGASV